MDAMIRCDRRRSVICPGGFQQPWEHAWQPPVRGTISANQRVSSARSQM